MKKSLLLLLTFLLLLSGCGKPAASSETVYLFPEDNIPDVTSNNFYTLFSYSETSSDVTYSYPQENPPYIGWGKEYKGYIYCKDAGSSKLYRYKPDGSELTLISEDLKGDFYFIDDWIYFCGSLYGESDYLSIYKAHLDGSNLTLIKENIEGGFYIYEDWIYFCRSTGDEMEGYVSINKARLDGSDESVLADEIKGIASFQFYNGYIYYINVAGDTICRIKPDGTGLIKMKANDINQFTVTEDYIYYISRKHDNEKFTGAIFRMNQDGTGLKTLYNKTVCNIAITEKWIYFSDYSPDNNDLPQENLYIRRMPIGGGKAELVVKARCTDIHYQNGMIVYSDYDDNYSTYIIDISNNESRKIINRIIDGPQIKQKYFVCDWVWYVTIGTDVTKLNKIKLDGSENQQLDVPLMLPIETDYSYYFETDPYLGNWTFIKTLGEDPAAFGASVIGSGIVINKKRYIEHTDSCENPVYSFQDSSMDELAKAGVPTAELQADKVVRVNVTSGDFESSFWVLDDTFIIFPYHDGKTFCVPEKTSNIPTNLDNIGRIFARYYKESMTSIVTYYGNWTGKGTWGYGYTPQEGGRDLSDAHISLSQEVYRVGNQTVENPSYKITPVSRSSIREGAGPFAYEMTMGFESPSVVCVMVCASTEDAASGKYVDRFWVINNEEIVFQGSGYYRAVRE